MARSKKVAPAQPAPSPEPASPERSAGPGLMWLGWTLAAVGGLTGWATAGHDLAPWGYGAAAVGLALAGAGMVLAGRAPAAPGRILSTLGAVLLVGGGAGLVYPCFVTREELRALHESASFVPALAVASALIGIVLLVIGLTRQRSSEAPFALENVVVSKLQELNPKRFFYDTWKEIDREAAAERAAREAAGKTGYDWRPLVVFATGAVFLALMEYFGHAPTLHAIVGAFPRAEDGDGFFDVLQRSAFWEPPFPNRPRGLTDFVWWSGWRVLGFFLLPAIVVKLVLRERLSDYGLSTAGFLRHAWIYVVFFGIVLVAVVVVSFEEDGFQSYYPFYKHASRSWYDFWAWELLYAAQFFSLEFFFRGFWLKAAKTSMGSHAIYAMVVPYCMIHFGKPFLETLAAILAGIVLGTLALRTRSIWSGFLIHVSVAISMDLAVLLQTSGLPDRWWPPV